MSIRGFGTTELLVTEVETFTVSARFWPHLRRHPSALFGLAVLASYALLSLAGPVLIQYDPTHQDLSQVLLPPSGAHPLGTDQLGRDELTRLLYGARYSLTLGFLSVIIGLGVGLPLGAISGFFGSWIDLALQRLTDILLSFPAFLLALALVAGLGVGVRNIVVAVGVSSIPVFIRLIRASVLSIRELAYVEAARALGMARWRIILRHVIPNALAPAIVQATLQLGAAILVAAGLGFLGLGVQEPTPEWGAMLGEARNYIFTDANLATFPGLAIFLAVLAFNLLGDGLRDALDPRLTR